MAVKYPIPMPNALVLGAGGLPTREWYNYWQNLADGSGGPTNEELLNDITIISDKLGSPDGTPENIPPQGATGNVVGLNSIFSQGVLPGIVTLTLQGDVQNPGNTYYYGTDSSGAKSFYSISSALLPSSNVTLTTDSGGQVTFDLSDVTPGTAGRLYGLAFDAKGRLSEQHTIDVVGVANRTTVTGGDGSGATIGVDIASTYAGQTSITTLGTITTGAWNGSLVGVQYGGTGANLSATGGAGQYVKQSTAGGAFTVGTIPASDIGSGQALTSTNDTNVTITLGGTPATALLKATSLTMGWSGTLSIARGGTGQATANAAFNALSPMTTTGDLITFSGGVATRLGVGSEGQVLGVSGGIPAWVAAGGTGTVTSVALTMPADFSVSGSPITSSGTFGVTYTTQSANVVHAGPASGAAATPTWRALVAADIPDLSGTYQPLDADLTAIAALSTTGIAVRTAANTWSTRTLSNGTGISLSNADGTAGNPVIGLANTAVSAGSYGDATHVATFTVDAQGRLTSAGSTAISFPASSVTSVFGRTGAVVATSGDYSFSLISGTASATQGGTGQTTYALGDIIYSSATNTLSKLPGNTTTAKQYLSQTGTGTVSSAPAWAAIAGADVTGAALTKTDDTNVTLTLGGTPATALLRAASITVGWSGTLSIARGGTGQATASAAFDALAPTTTSQDLIVRGASGNGRLGVGANGTVLTVTGGVVGWSAPATSGTVTSVGLSLPSIFTVSGSPVTSSGTLTGTLANQASNSVFAGPASGSAAAPTFRALVAADVPLPTDYISGLKLIWNSATSISVGTGSAVIPSTGKLEVVSSQLTLSSLSLSASTFYHVYLFDNAGTPAIECVTTAPVIYNGTAYQKTGDATRRYIGSVLTDASGNIYRFQHNINQILFVATTTGTPFRVLNNGMSTSRVSVSLTSLLPVTADVATFHLQNTSSTATAMLIDTPETGFTGITGIWSVGNGQTAFADVPVLTRTFIYIFSSAPTGSGGFVDIIGYKFNR